tara:strand:+ start:426 stop:779 length:354 start_codon:yes stop_codon:yes gene_type:complete
MSYDENNIFAKILRKEIPCDKVYEDDEILSFKDINPQALIHVLVIPKKKYVSFDDFIKNGDPDFIVSFFKKIKIIIDKLGVSESGYRIISNHGIDANQEVPHFHFHILAGEKLGELK